MNSEYDYLLNKYKPKKNKFNIFYKVIMLLLVGSYVGLLIFGTYYLFPIIHNFNNLTTKISSEVDYYHSIISQQNNTVIVIEDKINKFLDNENINNVLTIIKNLNIITSQMNITLIQNDLNTIANDLNKIIPH
jgi:hypothetical protein